MKFAAVEGGGTTWVVAIAQDKPENIIERAVFDTVDSPQITLTNVKDWLLQKSFDSIGIASFGPLDANPGSSTFGYITSTPKPGWKNTNVLKLLGIYDEFSDKPFLFDTDVNAPALAEYMLQIQQVQDSSINSFAYITVGTGVGVGIVANGNTVKGLLHPEAGHISVRPHPRDSFGGNCPFHGACIEGMCATGAIAKRLNCARSELANISDDDEIWDLEAYYIAQLCANLLMIVSPEKIAIGGGVLHRTSLFPKIRQQFLEIVNQYIQHPMISSENIDQYISPSVWGDSAGIIGAAYLAFKALEDRK